MTLQHLTFSSIDHDPFRRILVFFGCFDFEGEFTLGQNLVIVQQHCASGDHRLCIRPTDPIDPAEPANWDHLVASANPNARGFPVAKIHPETKEH